MRGSRRIVAVIGLLMLPSCAPARVDIADCAGNAATPPFYYVANTPGTVTTTRQDRDFLCQAATSGTAELTFARIALQRSQNPAVRNFAWQVAGDHGRANQELTTLAVDQAGLTLPQGLSNFDLIVRNDLVTRTGPGFDQAYLQVVTGEHHNAIPYFQQELASGSQPDIRRFAEQTLPMLQRHIQMAQGLGAQLSGSPAAPSYADSRASLSDDSSLRMNDSGF